MDMSLHCQNLSVRELEFFMVRLFSASGLCCRRYCFCKIMRYSTETKLISRSILLVLVSPCFEVLLICNNRIEMIHVFLYFFL